jgi:hypothetical protein
MSFVFAGTPVSSTNKHDCHEITEILLKAALGNNNDESVDRSTFSMKYRASC